VEEQNTSFHKPICMGGSTSMGRAFLFCSQLGRYQLGQKQLKFLSKFADIDISSLQKFIFFHLPFGAV